MVVKVSEDITGVNIEVGHGYNRKLVFFLFTIYNKNKDTIRTVLYVK